MKRGDIVLVPVPLTSGLPGKARPALAVQSNHNNRRLQDTIVAVITSTTHRVKLEPTQLLVEISTPDNIGRISGYGWGLGYVGGLLSLALAYPLISGGFAADNLPSYRLSFAVTAGFFLLAALPTRVEIRFPLCGMRCRSSDRVLWPSYSGPVPGRCSTSSRQTQLVATSSPSRMTC